MYEFFFSNFVSRSNLLTKLQRLFLGIFLNPHAERELLLIKVNAPPGVDRSEIIQIAEIFRARILDVSDASLTMSVTGDPGKMAAFQKVLSKFGIIELVRTGRIALKRGNQLFEGEAVWNIDRAQSTKASGEGEAVPAALQSVHDVYSGSGASDDGVWSVKNVLDAAYTPDGKGFEPYTLSIDVHDVPGVLNQVTGVFARRGYNIQSLAVGNSEKEGQSRITTVVPGDDTSINKLIKQLNKLVYVEQVTDLHTVPHVARELMLVKVNCSAEQRGELMNLAQIFRGSICDVSLNTVTIEVVGKEDKMRALKEILQTYGILEVARTGRVALSRESGVDTKYLSNVAGTRIML